MPRAHPHYLVFGSSVQKEFVGERRAVKEFIEGDPLLRRFFNVFLFEDVPASGQRPDQLYLAEVDRCDVYLGLLGNDYGYQDRAGEAPPTRLYGNGTSRGQRGHGGGLAPSDTAGLRLELDREPRFAPWKIGREHNDL